MVQASPRHSSRFGRRSLASDTSWVATGTLLSIAAGLALSVVGANVLDLSEFAALTWVLACRTYLAALARFGAMQAAPLIVVRARDKRRASLGLILVPVGLGFALSAAWHFIIEDAVLSLTDDRAAFASVASLLVLWIPVAAVVPVMASLLRGIDKFAMATVLDEWSRLAVLAAALGVVGLAESIGLKQAILIAIGFEYVFAVVGVGMLLASTTPTTPSEPNNPRLLLRTAAGFYVMSVVSLLIPQAGVWLVSLVDSASEVAHLGLAVRLILLFSLPFLIGSRVFGPRIAEAANQQSFPAIESHLRLLATGAFGATLVTMSAFFLIGEPLIRLVFGAHLTGAYAPTLILGLGVAANAGSGLCMAVLANGGGARLVATASFLAGLVFVVGGLVLGNAYGAVGVASAATVALVFQNVWMMVEVHRRHSIHTMLMVWPGDVRAAWKRLAL